MDKGPTLILALVAYLIFITSLGWYWMRRVKGATDFLMAGRRLGVVIIIGTALATTIGTGSTMGTVGLAYSGGWGGCLWALGLGTGMILVGVIFAPMRRHGLMTLGEEIACYYGNRPVLTHLANFAIFLSMVCWIGVHIMGGGLYISAMVDISFPTAALIATIGFAGVTMLGGYMAVVYTDVVQVSILTVGFVALTAFALDQVGGFAGLRAGVPAGYLTFFGVGTLGWKKVLSIPLALCLSMLPEPAFRHRLYSARSERDGRRGLMTAGGLAILFSFAMAILGMATYVLNPDMPMQDRALPWLVLELLPLWFAAVVLVSAFAATFSSADSDATTGALFFIRHLCPALTGRYPRRAIAATRWTMAAMFAVALVVVLQFQSIVDYVVNFVSIVLSGLAVVVVLGRYWRGASWQGAVAAMIAGAVVSLIVIVVPAQKEFWGEAILPATMAALIAEIGVSLLTPSPKPSIEEVAAEMRTEREAIDG